MKRRLQYTPEELEEYRQQQEREKQQQIELDEMRMAELAANPNYRIKGEDGGLSSSTDRERLLSSSASGAFVPPPSLMVVVDDVANPYFRDSYDLFFSDLPAIFPPPPTLVVPSASSANKKKKPRGSLAAAGASGGGTLVAPSYVPLPMFPHHKQELVVRLLSQLSCRHEILIACFVVG